MSVRSHAFVAPARFWPAGLARDALGPLLVALALAGTLLVALLRADGFNPTGPAHIGDRWDGRQYWTPTTRVEHGIGYDGQFFFYLAHDPFLTGGDPAVFLDRPAYRAGRLLYPLIVWAMTFGRPEAVPWGLLGVNLVMVLVGTAAAVDLLHSLGANRWLALGFALNPAILIGLVADLSEPTALALIVVGLALWARKRHRSAGLVLALATLAREISLLVPLGFALDALAVDRSQPWRARWRRAAAYIAPLGLPALWHLVVWVRLGSLPMLQQDANFGLPFGGALYRAGVLVGLQVPLLGEPRPDNGPAELALIGVSVVVILAGLTKVLWRRDAWTIQLWLQAAAVLCTSPLIWIALGSYARTLGPLYLFYGLVAVSGSRIARKSRSTECREDPWQSNQPS